MPVKTGSLRQFYQAHAMLGVSLGQKLAALSKEATSDLPAALAND
jgi:hypothetical protein